MFKKLIRNPFFIFLPFLGYYTYLIVHNKWPSLYGDEIRYVDFAKNLLKGFYSPPMPHINLWNGPGYPILLMPFEALHIPDLYITLMNGLYLYLAIVLLHKAITLVANFKIAAILCLLLAIYPNALAVLPILYTEAFTGLLVSGFIYAVTLLHIKGKNKYAVTAGLVLGYIILTKIIFGYVVVLCLVTCLGILLFKKNKTNTLRAVKILAIAFAVSTPYLAYTYRLTGKMFYWGNSGGMSLYWMSTPFDGEYGDWKNPNLTNNQYPALKSKDAVAALKKNHGKDMDLINRRNEIEQDVIFKMLAIRNIQAHPMKFANNYVNNVSRMLFNFPYSYAYQDGAIVRNIMIGSSVLWASIIALGLTLYNWRRIKFPVKFALFITGIYLALSGALSAYPRQLDIMIPVLLFWIGYLVGNIKMPGFKFSEDIALEDIELMELSEIGVRVEDAG